MIFNVQILTLEGREPQATITANQGTTNTTPFIPDPTSLQPEPESNNSKDGMTKSLIEYLFLSVVILIVFSIIVRRFARLKRENQPYSAFFNSSITYPSVQYQGVRNFPRTTGTSPPFPGQPYPELLLTRLPPAYIQDRTRHVCAADVDSSGRRAATTELDHGGELGDKDALPAYDNYGGPPKYFELEMQTTQTRLFGRGSSSRATVDQPGSRLDNVDIPRSMPSHDAQQDSQRGNIDNPPDPPEFSDGGLRRSSATYPSNDAARPSEPTTLTNNA